MSNSSFHLYQLQKVDLRLDQIELRGEKITAQLLNNPKLRAAEAKVKAGKLALHKKEEALKVLEEQSKSRQIKIELSEAALYGGKNTNPKELKDLQLEIESLKRTQNGLEEEQLTIMAEIETLNQQQLEKEDSYQTALAENEKENQQLVSERDELEKEKEKLFKERQAASGQLTADVVTLYESLRATKKHIAIATIDEESCSACGSEITAATIQKARGSAGLSFCPSCGRILYAG